jgi:hypothetical protein
MLNSPTALTNELIAILPLFRIDLLATESNRSKPELFKLLCKPFVILCMVFIGCTASDDVSDQFGGKEYLDQDIFEDTLGRYCNLGEIFN